MSSDLEFVDPGYLSTTYISGLTLTEDFRLLHTGADGAVTDFTPGYAHHLLTEFKRMFGEDVVAQTQMFDLEGPDNSTWGAVVIADKAGAQVQVAVENADPDRIIAWITALLEGHHTTDTDNVVPFTGQYRPN